MLVVLKLLGVHTAAGAIKTFEFRLTKSCMHACITQAGKLYDNTVL